MLVLGVAAASAIFASEGRMLNPKYTIEFDAYLLFAGEEFDNAMQGIEFTKVCDNAPSPTSSTEAPSTDDSTTDDSPTDDFTTEEPTTAEPYDDNTCANGATPTYVAADLRFGGMIVDTSDPSQAKHETFYFGTGDTKYSTTKTPLTYTKEERFLGEYNSFWLYKVQISHPLVRSYGAADSAVYIWTRPQSWMPDRKELHTTVNADDTSIKIVKEDDDTNAPRKDDTIALHNQYVAINRTVVGVTQFAAANGDAYWEVELDEAPGHVFEADANTHLKLHETSPERDTDLGDSGSSGLSGGALGGIIGGSIGGVLLIAVAVTKFMPGKKYSSLEGV